MRYWYSYEERFAADGINWKPTRRSRGNICKSLVVKMETLSKKLGDWVEMRTQAIWTNLLTNHLWERMFKNTLATTLAVIMALIPAVVDVYGRASYLAVMVTVFGHPGRRFGMMAEALVLAVGGTVLGVLWSLLAVYLSSLVYETNAPAAYTIKGIFLSIALLFHGFLRSHTPRLFLFVLLLVIVTVVSLTGTAVAVSKTLATTLLYPILSGVAILLLVNTLVFPEFSSSFLGITTIETLGETVGALRDAGKYFIAVADDTSTIEKTEKKSEPDEQPTTLAEKAIETPADAGESFLTRIIRIFIKSKESTNTGVEPTSKTVTLKSLTDSKAKLRAKLASCKAAQQECNFEIAFAVLPPRDLKTISDTNMKLLVANTISLIGACESKYALMGGKNDTGAEDRESTNPVAGLEEGPDTEADSTRPSSAADDSHDDSDYHKYLKSMKKKRKRKQKSKSQLELNMEDLALVKPRKEIEFGDIELVKHLVNRIAKPLSDLQETIDRSVDVVTSCLAYCYDVPKLPSGAKPPTGIQLEEIDIRVDILNDAIVSFDRDSSMALEGAGTTQDVEHLQLDIMPRMETFLISSFLLNLRQAGLHTLEMLRHSRVIVEKRQARHNRRRLWAPRINWRKWLSSGGEDDMLALPEAGRKEARTGKKDDIVEKDSPSSSKRSLLKKEDIELGSTDLGRPAADESPRPRKKLAKPVKDPTLTYKLRNALADVIEFLVGSEDVLYAIKLTVAVLLVCWPAFLHNWNSWYSLNRGVWAALQLVLITEVALGTSISVFILRGFGTTLGCVWGYVAYQAGNGNRIVCVVLLVIGIIPATYIQLGSKYIKAGMVAIISMCIVALATIDRVVPGTPTENFLKRLVAFLIGGVVALIVEVILFPVKARDRLVESLAAAITQMSEMEGCLAYGIETETNIDVHSKSVSQRFEKAKSKAEGALAAAETFLPFCASEPRLKGSFEGLALIYGEILYVLHAIVDRMDNMLHLRQEYGSGVLEELNAQVYPYRRNVAGSITLILFAVHEALTTKLPLPQFLPSARLAHLRMVNRVREVVLAKTPARLDDGARSEMEMKMIKHVVRKKFLSWNAASAGQIEVIEYLEELIDLTKLLVGANEFRSGLLTRPTYQEYVNRVGRGFEHHGKPVEAEDDELRDIVPEPQAARQSGLKKRRTAFSKQDGIGNTPDEDEQKVDEEDLPRSLQRVRSRRIEKMRLEKSRSSTMENGRR